MFVASITNSPFEDDDDDVDDDDDDDDDITIFEKAARQQVEVREE